MAGVHASALNTYPTEAICVPGILGTPGMAPTSTKARMMGGR